MNPSDFQTLSYEVDDHVATITFTRPEQRNTFTTEGCLELVAAFDLVDADDDVRAVILTGTGKSFCAGADLGRGFVSKEKVEQADPDDPMLKRGYVGDGVPRDGGGITSLRIAACTKPVIVAFNGSAVGVGVTMTLPADIRIAVTGTKLGLVFGRRGLVPEAASSWFLPRVVGINKALEWCLTGRLVTAEEAHEAGLLNHVVEPEELLPKAREIAQEIVANVAPRSAVYTRRMLWSMLSASDPWEAHDTDSRAIYELGGSAEVKEGIASFLERRPAEFPGFAGPLPDYLPEWPRDASRV
ncbi:enoyl-CoA hydratase-related protein [Nocardioides insulae]|uniref:enoyl-CoA hydratase-related protein n=1 Tax=Nocardioides insulae TaxID=394734 RepID=UPI0004254C46|nr:enoyl-CoA hydratase-related protein [Nocardioides insulae]